jgi:3-oxoacyl-(acyl-carrier-protein) synthase
MRTFGRHAYFAGVTTIAGSAGQSLAAGGPLSLVAALEAMRRQEVFPIAGFETPEKDLEPAYVKAARPERVDCVMTSAMGVGGSNVVVLLTR